MKRSPESKDSGLFACIMKFIAVALHLFANGMKARRIGIRATNNGYSLER